MSNELKSDSAMVVNLLVETFGAAGGGVGSGDYDSETEAESPSSTKPQ